jgi:hypothetical protein
MGDPIGDAEKCLAAQRVRQALVEQRLEVCDAGGAELRPGQSSETLDEEAFVVFEVNDETGGCAVP